MRGLDDSLQPRTDNIGFFAAGNLAATTIGVADQACSIDYCDEALCVIQDLRVEIVLAQELRLHILHLGNIEQNATVLHNLSRVVADDKAVFQHVNDRSIPAQ